MDRKQHMEWCKERAVQYLDNNDVPNALASFTSDVTKHPETSNDAVGLLLAMEGTRLAMNDDVEGMRRFIEGFN